MLLFMVFLMCFAFFFGYYVGFSNCINYCNEFVLENYVDKAGLVGMPSFEGWETHLVNDSWKVVPDGGVVG